jgi:hypothetical protein
LKGAVVQLPKLPRVPNIAEIVLAESKIACLTASQFWILWQLPILAIVRLSDSARTLSHFSASPVSQLLAVSATLRGQAINRQCTGDQLGVKPG